MPDLAMQPQAGRISRTRFLSTSDLDEWDGDSERDEIHITDHEVPIVHRIQLT